MGVCNIFIFSKNHILGEGFIFRWGEHPKGGGGGGTPALMQTFQKNSGCKGCPLYLPTRGNPVSPCKKKKKVSIDLFPRF